MLQAYKLCGKFSYWEYACPTKALYYRFWDWKRHRIENAGALWVPFLGHFWTIFRTLWATILNFVTCKSRAYTLVFIGSQYLWMPFCSSIVGHNLDAKSPHSENWINYDACENGQHQKLSKLARKKRPKCLRNWDPNPHMFSNTVNKSTS